ncbi:MAG: hypothetical protein CGU28_08420 [Candidatus Dactylopiibacterium carminicum]|nr:MAG: hypothetical protein CGU28_08420 [Candidatus Dactylopiibacterium carminicum]
MNPMDCHPERIAAPLRRVLLGIGLCLGSLCAAQQAQAHSFEQAVVKDPTASFIDVPARRAYLQKAVTEGQLDDRLRSALPAIEDCRSTPRIQAQTGPMVIPSRYFSGNTGAIHPDYERVVALYRDFEDSLGRLSSLYVLTGNSDYAGCVLDQLADWADAGALLDYTPSERKQAWYQTEWSVGVAAMSLSLVITDPALDAGKKTRVLDWLKRVSYKQISEPGADISCCNNHSYWRGLQATMIGALTGDDALYRWGLGRYAQGIGQIAADGSFPLEMTRREQALHYQNYALQPLTMIAQIASRQGLDLYAYRENGRDIHDAVRFTLAAIQDETLIARHASEKQNRRAFAAGRGDLAWMEYYRTRFPLPDLGPLLSKPFFYPRNGGAVTLFVYTP